MPALFHGARKRPAARLGGYNVFCNPPYGRNTTGKWIQKAYEESRKPNTVVVCLVPSRTDTRWFHEYILGKAEIRFVKGRLKFGSGADSAPFPSMVAVYRSPILLRGMEK